MKDRELLLMSIFGNYLIIDFFNTSNTSNLKTKCRVQIGTTYKVRIKFFYEKFNSVV